MIFSWKIKFVCSWKRLHDLLTIDISIKYWTSDLVLIDFAHTPQGYITHAGATMGWIDFWVCAVQMISFLLSAILGMQYLSYTFSAFIHLPRCISPWTIYVNNGIDLAPWISFTPDLLSELIECSAVITRSIFSQTFTKDNPELAS